MPSSVFQELMQKHEGELRQNLAERQTSKGIDSGNSALGRFGHGFRKGGSKLFSAFNNDLTEDPLVEAQNQAVDVADNLGLDPNQVMEASGNKSSTGLMLADMGGSLLAQLPQFIGGAKVLKALVPGTGIGSAVARDAALFGGIEAASAPDGERLKRGLHGAVLGGAFGAISKGVEPIASKLGQRVAAGGLFGGVAAVDEAVTTGDVTALNVGLQGGLGAILHSPVNRRTQERKPMSQGGTPTSILNATPERPVVVGGDVSPAPPPGSSGYTPRSASQMLRAAPKTNAERPGGGPRPQYVDEVEQYRRALATKEAAALKREIEAEQAKEQQGIEAAKFNEAQSQKLTAERALNHETEPPPPIKRTPEEVEAFNDLQAKRLAAFREKNAKVDPHTGRPEKSEKPKTALSSEQVDRLTQAKAIIVEKMNNADDPKEILRLKKHLVKIEDTLNMKVSGNTRPAGTPPETPVITRPAASPALSNDAPPPLAGSKVGEPAPPVIAAKPATTNALPKTLSGAKPRYLTHEVEFDSEFDKVSYILAQKSLSKADADYLAWAMKVSGKTEDVIRSQGRLVREKLKGIANTHEGEGPLKVPKIIHLKGDSVVAPPVQEGVPMMVTKQQKQELLDRGFKKDEIESWTPAQVQEKLKPKVEAPKVEAPKVEDATQTQLEALRLKQTELYKEMDPVRQELSKRNPMNDRYPDYIDSRSGAEAQKVKFLEKQYDDIHERLMAVAKEIDSLTPKKPVDTPDPFRSKRVDILTKEALDSGLEGLDVIAYVKARIGPVKRTVDDVAVDKDVTPQTLKLVAALKGDAKDAPVPVRDPKGRFVSKAKLEAAERGELHVDKDNVPDAHEMLNAMDCRGIED